MRFIPNFNYAVIKILVISSIAVKIFCISSQFCRQSHERKTLFPRRQYVLQTATSPGREVWS